MLKPRLPAGLKSRLGEPLMSGVKAMEGLVQLNGLIQAAHAGGRTKQALNLVAEAVRQLHLWRTYCLPTAASSACRVAADALEKLKKRHPTEWSYFAALDADGL